MGKTPTAQGWWGIGATVCSVPIAGLVITVSRCHLGIIPGEEWGGKTCLLLYSLILCYYSVLQLPLVMGFSWFCLEVKGLKRRRKASLFMLSVNFPVGLTAAGEIV